MSGKSIFSVVVPGAPSDYILWLTFSITVLYIILSSSTRHDRKFFFWKTVTQLWELNLFSIEPSTTTANSVVFFPYLYSMVVRIKKVSIVNQFVSVNMYTCILYTEHCIVCISMYTSDVYKLCKRVCVGGLWERGKPDDMIYFLPLPPPHAICILHRSTIIFHTTLYGKVET